MLTMICNRCGKLIGTVRPDSQRSGPGSKFSALVFDEKTRHLEEMCELDLCEACARELADTLANWFPIVREAQERWNKEPKKEFVWPS